MDWGDAVEVMPGVTVHCEPCHHWSARGIGDRSMALWAAFVIATPAGRIYHVGDTGFHDGINYRAVRARYGSFRLANLPIGAYEPRWFMQGQHQNPEEAVAGMQLCNAAFVAGHHWRSFRLTNEAPDAPRQALFAALDAAGVSRERFRPMMAGEVFDVPSEVRRRGTGAHAARLAFAGLLRHIRPNGLWWDERGCRREFSLRG